MAKFLKIIMVVGAKILVTIFTMFVICFVNFMDLIVYPLSKFAKVGNTTNLSELGQSALEAFVDILDDIWGNTRDVIKEIRSE